MGLGVPSLGLARSEPHVHLLTPSLASFTYHCLAGKGGMEKNMETTITGYLGTATRLQSFIPSFQKVR